MREEVEYKKILGIENSMPNEYILRKSSGFVEVDGSSEKTRISEIVGSVRTLSVFTDFGRCDFYLSTESPLTEDKIERLKREFEEIYQKL